MSDPSVLEEAKDFLKYLETLQSLQNLTYENKKDPYLDYYFSKQEEESSIETPRCCGQDMIEDNNYYVCLVCSKSQENTSSHLLNLEEIPHLSSLLNKNLFSCTRVINHIKNITNSEPTHQEIQLAERFVNYWRSSVSSKRIYLNNKQIALNILNHTRKKTFRVVRRHKDIEKCFAQFVYLNEQK